MRALALSILALTTLACSHESGTPSTEGSGGAGSTTRTGGAAGSGGGSTANVIAFTPGPPLTAPDETWTWVPIEGSACGNGSPTGIGVNLTTKSSRVLVYLEEGGACWSNITCNDLGTASYFSSGYGQSDFEAESTDPSYLALAGGFFDRTSATNPFKDYSFVYVPYCTGDIHAGASVGPFADDPSQTGHFVGFNNLTLDLDRIVPTFPSADRVYLAGSSAGGFGAAYDWWHVQQAFGSIRVDLIDDSGTPMPPDVPIGELQTWIQMWGLSATAPAGCPACLQSLAGFFGFYEKNLPTHHGALLSYAEDSTLPDYFMISQQQFDMGLAEDVSTYFTPGANLKCFIAPGAGHVLWFSPDLATKGVTLRQFLTDMVTDAPAWADAQP
jgi:hypothetical protein